jgi:dual specificity protein kinase YAK1
MDQQNWTPYSESAASAARQSRYAPQGLPQQQSYAPSNAASRGTSAAAGSSQPQSRSGMEYGDRDGDVAMEDADPYKPKPASQNMGRATHQRMPSNVQQEESTAARRYSPMNLSPASPFPPSGQQPTHPAYTSYTPQASSRASPTRNSSYIASTNASYYASPPGLLP